jgi:hypothetical protein
MTLAFSAWMTFFKQPMSQVLTLQDRCFNLWLMG